MSISVPTPFGTHLAEVDHWHAVYCERVKELFERYKGFNPDYKHKELLVE